MRNSKLSYQDKKHLFIHTGIDDMKIIGFIFLLALGVIFWIGIYHPDWIPEDNSENIGNGVEKVTLEGHEYLRNSLGQSKTLVHAESCPCKSISEKP